MRRCGFAVLAGVVALGSSPASADDPAVPVGVAAASVQDVPVLQRSIGSVQALQSVLVRARVDGTLDKIVFTEGQEVHAGDLLAQIDPRPYAATLAQVQAKLAADEAQSSNARRDLGRFSNLANRDFASRQQVDTQSATVSGLDAQLKGDAAQVASAQLNLDFCRIVAPLDGRVGLRIVDPGNLIHANDAQGIVSITQVHPITVLFTLPQDALPTLQTAMHRGKLSVDAWSADDRTELGRGELLTMDNTIDTTTGTIRLKAVFPNADDRLWPGQFVNVRLQVDRMTGVLTVPSEAVQRGPSGLYVYAVKADRTVAVTPVELRQDDGRVAVLTRGLDAGMQVVIAGQSRLQNGSKVDIAPPKGTGS